MSEQTHPEHQPRPEQDEQNTASQVPPEAAAAEEAASAPEVQECDRLQQELAEAQKQLLRAQADLENYRRRVRREMEEERRFAAAPLMRDLFPAMDNLQRAIDAAEKNGAATSLVEGVRMVAQQIAQVLEQHGCRRIPTKNEVFDPHRHEAVAQQPSDEHPAGTIVLETLAGYELHDRVLRPAQVIVSSGPANPS